MDIEYVLSLPEEKTQEEIISILNSVRETSIKLKMVSPDGVLVFDGEQCDPQNENSNYSIISRTYHRLFIPKTRFGFINIQAEKCIVLEINSDEPMREGPLLLGFCEYPKTTEYEGVLYELNFGWRLSLSYRFKPVGFKEENISKYYYNIYCFRLIFEHMQSLGVNINFTAGFESRIWHQDPSIMFSHESLRKMSYRTPEGDEMVLDFGQYFDLTNIE